MKTQHPQGNFKFKTIKKDANKNGVVYALAEYQGAFSVHCLKENYNGKVKGGILKTWTLVKKGLSEKEAEEIFNKRIKGKK